MSKIVTQAESQLREAVLAAVAAAAAAGELPDAPVPPFAVEVPGDRAHGDLSANAA